MADMRLIVAGAGGRMGRTLIKAIFESKGLDLAGAIEAPGSAVIGRDSASLRASARTASRLRPIRRRSWPTRWARRFHHSGRHPRAGGVDRAARLRAHHRHHGPHRRETRS